MLSSSPLGTRATVVRVVDILAASIHLYRLALVNNLALNRSKLVKRFHLPVVEQQFALFITLSLGKFVPEIGFRGKRLLMGSVCVG